MRTQVSGARFQVSGSDSPLTKGVRGLSGDARHTHVYLQTMETRCQCCGNFMPREKAPSLPWRADHELCLGCQLVCSVQLLKLERRVA